MGFIYSKELAVPTWTNRYLSLDGHSSALLGGLLFQTIHLVTKGMVVQTNRFHQQGGQLHRPE